MIEFTIAKIFTRVDFIDRSVGAQQVEWDFGVAGIDTDTSTLRDPVYVFPGPGVYMVTQTAYNFTTNCQHSETIEVTISDPEANFSLAPLQGCVPHTVTGNGFF